MSIAILGGLCLIVGAWFTYTGNVFRAVGVYIIADVVWITMAFVSGDVIGGTLTVIGTILGIGAFYKMQVGKFRKTI